MATMQVNFRSEYLHRQTTFSAIIPLGSKSLKTLYLLHGLHGNYADWITNTRITYWAETRGLAVIMPSAYNSFYTDVGLAKHGEFIGRELVETTRELFPLSAKREDTFIAGLSMGGYGAMRTGLKYNETFSAIASLSGAFITDESPPSNDDETSLVGNRSYFESVFGDLEKLPETENNPKKLITDLIKSGAKIPEIYMCCGTEDFLLQNNRDFHDFLKTQKVKHIYYENTGSHNWEYWDENILSVLNWLPLEDF